MVSGEHELPAPFIIMTKVDMVPGYTDKRLMREMFNLESDIGVFLNLQGCSISCESALPKVKEWFLKKWLCAHSWCV